MPDIVFRHGSCSAAVFESLEDGTPARVEFKKSLQGKNGGSLDLLTHDIPKAVLVLNKAYEYLTSARTDS